MDTCLNFQLPKQFVNDGVSIDCFLGRELTSEHKRKCYFHGTTVPVPLVAGWYELLRSIGNH